MFLKVCSIAVSKGCVVIDNSSVFRMNKDVPLVVPEVNPEKIRENVGIIANPNCSTIQAVVALKPLDLKYGIKRVVYSTYQAVSGAGRQGVLDLENGLKGEPTKKFPYPIVNNCLPHIDSFLDDGYTKEEYKLINETRKILNKPLLPVTATAVRVPVKNCHSECINVEFERDFDVFDVKQLLQNSPGVLVIDDPSKIIILWLLRLMVLMMFLLVGFVVILALGLVLIFGLFLIILERVLLLMLCKFWSILFLLSVFIIFKKATI